MKVVTLALGSYRCIEFPWTEDKEATTDKEVKKLERYPLLLRKTVNILF